MVATVERHRGEIHLRVGFIASRLAKRVMAF